MPSINTAYSAMLLQIYKIVAVKQTDFPLKVLNVLVWSAQNGDRRAEEVCPRSTIPHLAGYKNVTREVWWLNADRFLHTPAQYAPL